MNASFTNLYDDKVRADAYAGLEFPGTYYLAFRDLPAIISEHVSGSLALDFGCGAGRSTRFLRNLGFDVAGVDISEPMLAHAREHDPDGKYFLVVDGELDVFSPHSFDLITCMFTFDNVPTMEKKLALFQTLNRLLKDEGRIINLVSSPEIYCNEWTSFSTGEFPENRDSVSGDTVRIVMLDVPDQRPVEDIIWLEKDYLEIYRQAGLHLAETYRPLGKSSDPCTWVSETSIAPWVIYVLGRAGTASL
jgi:ubiquinone/menaquinone biosynthesis C-methylase UbiE